MSSKRAKDIWVKKLIYTEHMSDNISGHLSSLTHSLTCKVLHKFVLVKMDIKVTVQNGH
jgi:hypothetical protein